MKLCLILFTLILIGCNSGNDVKNKVQVINKDTLMINNVVFYLDTISKIDFKSIKKQRSQERTKEIIDDTVNVKRDSLRLIFHLKNRADSLLVNDTIEGWSSFIKYTYLESFNNMDYWLVEITYYEGHGFMLMDKEDGSKIWIWSEPVFSPNKKYFMSYSCDLESGYVPNGFQLFEIRNRKVKEHWSKEINNWGPSDISWKNDNTIYVEQLRLDFNDTENPNKISYKSMQIK